MKAIENRKIVTLREVNGLTFQQIAKILNLSKQTVWERYHYWKDRIKVKGIDDLVDEVYED